MKTIFNNSIRSLSAALVVGLLFSACLKNPNPSNSSPPVIVTLDPPQGSNVMLLTVNGSLCGDPNFQYNNEPCVSVTICQPGTSNCQTISNILLDTGSYGLRIFSSLITVPLTPETDGAATVAECVQYADGASDWGSVQVADVKLGGEAAVSVPIQTINASFSTAPAACSSSQSFPDTSPQEAGFNGILGLGLKAYDCGTHCANITNNGQYYDCTGNTCNAAKVALANQVQNPVALLPVDNNGLSLHLPSVPVGGATTANGYILLGIGTQSNNAAAAGVVAYSADSNAEFSAQFTAYSNSAIPSFIDSGSSVLFLPPPSGNQLPDCNSAQGGSHGSVWSGFYCPSSSVSLSATNISSTGTPTGAVPFQIGNGYNLLNSSYWVFMNVGVNAGTGVNALFDWGLPFFFGRTVYVGLEGVASSLGTGPYWAY